MAAAAQVLEEEALRPDASRRPLVVQGAEQFHGTVANPRLDRDGPLSWGGQHPLQWFE